MMSKTWFKKLTERVFLPVLCVVLLLTPLIGCAQAADTVTARLRPDYTIIDGFHRWTVSGREPLHTKLQGKVPVVIVAHSDKSDDIYGTITHNRARGTHLLEPMKAIVKQLIDEGKTVPEIGKQLGMKPEEIFRLSDFSRDDFLEMMTRGVQGYSKAAIYKKV